jgi:hypothetical protein
MPLALRSAQFRSASAIGVARGETIWCGECKCQRSVGCRYTRCPMVVPVPARGFMPFAGHRNQLEVRLAALDTKPRRGSGREAPSAAVKSDIARHGERF